MSAGLGHHVALVKVTDLDGQDTRHQAADWHIFTKKPQSTEPLAAYFPSFTDWNVLLEIIISEFLEKRHPETADWEDGKWMLRCEVVWSGNLNVDNTLLNAMDGPKLQMVFRLMNARGWKDHIWVQYRRLREVDPAAEDISPVLHK
jgi:hypothetical protein